MPTAPLLDLTRRSHRRIIGSVIVLGAIGMLVWSVYLAFALPLTYDTRQWWLTWGGFDLIIAAALTITGWTILRGRQIAVLWCVATSTLLFCDAWFDATLSLDTRQQWPSITLAVGVELPLALWFGWTARRLAMARRLADGRPLQGLGSIPMPTKRE